MGKKIVKENYTHRLDGREHVEFEADIKQGQEEEKISVAGLQSWHNKLNLASKIVQIQSMTPDGVIKGQHVDKGDFLITVLRDGHKMKHIMEVKKFPYYKDLTLTTLRSISNIFRFKEEELQRCKTRQLGFFYFHNTDQKSLHLILRAFSVEEIDNLLATKEFISDPRFFGGKPHCRNFLSEYNDWVDMKKYDQVELYKEHASKVINEYSTYEYQTKHFPKAFCDNFFLKDLDVDTYNEIYNRGESSASTQQSNSK